MEKRNDIEEKLKRSMMHTSFMHITKDTKEGRRRMARNIMEELQNANKKMAVYSNQEHRAMLHEITYFLEHKKMYDLEKWILEHLNKHD